MIVCCQYSHEGLLQFMEWGKCTQGPWHLMADGSGSKVAVEKYCSRSYINIFKPTKCLLSQIRISSSWKHQNVCQELMELRIFLLIVTSQPRSYFECLFWGSYFVKQLNTGILLRCWVGQWHPGEAERMPLPWFVSQFTSVLIEPDITCLLLKLFCIKEKKFY